MFINDLLDLVKPIKSSKVKGRDEKQGVPSEV